MLPGGQDTERWILHLGEQRAGVALALDDAAQRGGDQVRLQDAAANLYSSGWNRWWLVRSTTVTSTSAPSSPRVTLSPPNPPPTTTTRCFPVIVIVPPLPSRPAPDKRGRRQRAVSCSSRSCSRPGGWLPARAEAAGAHRTRARAR